MKQELFDPQAFVESSSRIIYTPSPSSSFVLQIWRWMRSV